MTILFGMILLRISEYEAAIHKTKSPMIAITSENIQFIVETSGWMARHTLRYITDFRYLLLAARIVYVTCVCLECKPNDKPCQIICPVLFIKKHTLCE